jgi:general secretion pathway protein I
MHRTRSVTIRHTPARRLGFTLIEVLIALSILAIALAATMRASAMSITTAEDAQHRMHAMWVAQNRAAELTARRVFPAVGTENGTATMGSKTYRWEQIAAETPNTAFRKLDIRVLSEDARGERTLASLTVYLSRPLAAAGVNP